MSFDFGNFALTAKTALVIGGSSGIAREIASDASRFVTGSTLRVDGGYLSSGI